MASGDERRDGEGQEEEGYYYGDAATVGALRRLYAGYPWADVAALEPASSAAARRVRVRGAAQAVRAVGRRVAFLVLRQGSATVQCVVAAAGGGDGGGMARFAAGLSRESVVDVAGVVSLPREPVRGTTQQLVEIQVEKLHCVSRAIPNLPISLDDAARSEEDVARAKAAGEQLVHVGQDKRLDYRVIDLRTAANQAIFRVQCQVENVSSTIQVNKILRNTPKIRTPNPGRGDHLRGAAGARPGAPGGAGHRRRHHRRLHRRVPARGLRRRAGAGGDALLRPRQHQEDVALPARPQEAGAMTDQDDA